MVRARSASNAITFLTIVICSSCTQYPEQPSADQTAGTVHPPLIAAVDSGENNQPEEIDEGPWQIPKPIPSNEYLRRICRVISLEGVVLTDEVASKLTLLPPKDGFKGNDRKNGVDAFACKNTLYIRDDMGGLRVVYIPTAPYGIDEVSHVEFRQDGFFWQDHLRFVARETRKLSICGINLSHYYVCSVNTDTRKFNYIYDEWSEAAPEPLD